MIKNIFLPEKIGAYYLFSKRIVGLDIGKTSVNATQLRLSGNTITIEKSVEEKIESGPPATYNQRVQTTIKTIIQKLDTFDELYTSIPSNLVIFKELKLPFTNYDKIKMVIDFEVEPLLPFPIQNAAVDFIITKQIPEQNSAEVLVAAIQNQYLIQHLQLLKEIDLTPSVVGIDLFYLYGLYKKIPHYMQLTGNVVLLDIGAYTTRIAHIHDGQLRAIRSLNKGISHLVKNASEKLNIPVNQLIDYVMRFGLDTKDKPEYTNALIDALTNYLKDIKFTLASFTAQTDQEKSINQILLIGEGAQISGFVSSITELLQIPCALFDMQEIIDNKTITVKNKTRIPHTHIISLSTVLPSPVTQEFNLLTGEFRETSNIPLIKQTITALILTLIIVVTLFAFTIMETRKLSQEETEIETEAIKTLQKRFKAIPKDEDDLEEAIKTAKEEIAKEEKTWFAFSSQARASFLKYLLELTGKIDQESLGFKIDSIIFAQEIMTLKARVRDHEALKILERELRQSKLFSYVEPQTDPIFTMKIILVQNGEEA